MIDTLVSLLYTMLSWGIIGAVLLYIIVQNWDYTIPTHKHALDKAEIRMYEPFAFPIHRYIVDCGSYQIHTTHIPYRPKIDETTPILSEVPTARPTDVATTVPTTPLTSTSIIRPEITKDIPKGFGQPSILTGRPPLVLLHGFAGGSALWSMNIDALSREYDIIAIDLLGFGRSSRPQFRGNADDAIHYWVSSLELWRKTLGIEQMILCGHSLGSYVSMNYALKYPQYVSRIVSLCPFGIVSDIPSRKMSFGARFLMTWMDTFTPQIVVRQTGPISMLLMYVIRGGEGGEDSRYKKFYGHGDRRVSDYAYHMTVAPSGAGDYAFKTLIKSLKYPHAIRPLTDRLHQLSMPITVIYGERDTLVVNSTDTMLKHVKNVTVATIPSATHHVYASHPSQVHELMLQHLQQQPQQSSSSPLSSPLASLPASA